MHKIDGTKAQMLTDSAELRRLGAEMPSVVGGIAGGAWRGRSAAGSPHCVHYHSARCRTNAEQGLFPLFS